MIEAPPAGPAAGGAVEQGLVGFGLVVELGEGGGLVQRQPGLGDRLAGRGPGRAQCGGHFPPGRLGAGSDLTGGHAHRAQPGEHVELLTGTA